MEKRKNKEIRTPKKKMLIGEICEINERKALRISRKGKEDTIFVEDLIRDIVN